MKIKKTRRFVLEKVVRRTGWLSRIWALSTLSRSGTHLSREGWFRSARVQMSVDRNGDPIPWYTYAAISFLEEKITSEMSVFEFGSGNSTLWWSARVATVVSCEHDIEWFDLTRPKLGKNVKYIHAELAEEEYARSVRNLGDAFDIIVIDGRDRVKCARHSLGALSERGVIIWDNSDRPGYEEGFRLLIDGGFRRLDFVGMGPINPNGWSTGIFYRSGNCLGI